jgi:hypothetical protein
MLNQSSAIEGTCGTKWMGCPYLYYATWKEAPMFCDRCGTPVNSNAPECSSCGRTFPSAPLLPAEDRLDGHIRLMGILWLALSALRLLPGVVLIIAAKMGIQFLPPDLPPILGLILQAVVVLLWVNLICGVITGWALLSKQPWARTVAIVVAFFNLWDLPFGAALGIYTLWALLPAKAGRQYTEGLRRNTASARV